VICSAKYLVWFWAPSSRSVRSLPRATLQPGGSSLQQIQNFAKATTTLVLSILQSYNDRFLRSTPAPLPHRRDVSARKFLDSSSEGSTNHPVPTACVGLERDQPLRSCVAMSIYIATTPTIFYQRSHVLSAPEWNWESNSVFLWNLRPIRLGFHFRIYERQSLRSQPLSQRMVKYP